MSTKTFDCVEMKNDIQAKRWAEYQTHKDEFSSYLDFINSRLNASELGRRFLESKKLEIAKNR